mmetsp:Transcript_46736/g.69128  ORF Transcript_46736/g.69128 Transcript_46736/m.69128 type:complete len:119 (-) Transcript_46736:136-492(-)|eukprot:CAMPEP_0195520630 /NCGR_PEP_ID=MMETSP0794_2-20130614/17316_1 /TAXON_ID=515487 /ORGANISM="Stephanopyxis turris, Strain CCMP 815" /LENGTH=118 /DNA_ID=CAMNT_0040650029 /DNA_START=287 /DNA_END=643 /DNA_ORIENTATION=+
MSFSGLNAAEDGLLLDIIRVGILVGFKLRVDDDDDWAVGIRLAFGVKDGPDDMEAFVLWMLLILGIKLGLVLSFVNNIVALLELAIVAFELENEGAVLVMESIGLELGLCPSVHCKDV